MIRWMSDKKYYSKIFYNIYSIEAIVQRFQNDRIDPDDWRKLIKSLEAVIELRNSLSLDSPPEVVKNLIKKDYWVFLVKTLAHLNKVVEITPLGIKDSFDPRLK